MLAIINLFVLMVTITIVYAGQYLGMEDNMAGWRYYDERVSGLTFRFYQIHVKTINGSRLRKITFVLPMTYIFV